MQREREREKESIMLKMPKATKDLCTYTIYNVLNGCKRHTRTFMLIANIQKCMIKYIYIEVMKTFDINTTFATKITT